MNTEAGLKRLMIVMMLLLPCAALGQEQAAEEAATDSEQQVSEDDGQRAIDQGPVAGNGQAADEQVGDQSRLDRFIPSEQISQDLGVSFPVDI